MLRGELHKHLNSLSFKHCHYFLNNNLRNHNRSWKEKVEINHRSSFFWYRQYQKNPSYLILILLSLVRYNFFIQLMSLIPILMAKFSCNQEIYASDNLFYLYFCLSSLIATFLSAGKTIVIAASVEIFFFLT